MVSAMISQKKMDKNLENFHNLGFPSADALIEYHDSRQDVQNALDYEKAYTSLIERVKDKPHDAKIKFLIKQMTKLRSMVDEFSLVRDMYNFTDRTPSPEMVQALHLTKHEVERNNEILANLMVYRYENHISILDDNELAVSGKALAEMIGKIDERNAKEHVKAEKKYYDEHPDEYVRKLDKEKENFRETIEIIGKADEIIKSYSRNDA